MVTTTTNFNLNKPAVNDPTDEDLWGGYLNDNFDSLDTILLTARDYITTAKSANYTVTTSDRNKAVLVDASGGSVTISLPAAASAATGFTVLIKKTDSSSNDVVIDPNGSETIDGATTLTMNLENDAAIVVCDGTSWYTFNNVPAEVPDATTSTKGKVQLATDAEVKTGTETSKAVVPSSILSHEGVCKAWVSFESVGTLSVKDSYNVTSVTDNGEGDFTVNFDNNFANTGYAIAGFASIDTGADVGLVTANSGTSSSYKAVGSINIYVVAAGNGALQEANECSVSFFGELA